jgi:ectoine hydroxylase-related dioxygenase (phytanoyl-CoA dioxygenase family)
LAEFPSKNFLDKYSCQVTAKAGTYLVLDGMLFHKAGANKSSNERRALNHVIGLPFMGQVIDLPAAMAENNVSLPTDPRLRRYLGAQWGSVGSATEWREKKFS